MLVLLVVPSLVYGTTACEKRLFTETFLFLSTFFIQSTMHILITSMSSVNKILNKFMCITCSLYEVLMFIRAVRIGYGAINEM